MRAGNKRRGTEREGVEERGKEKKGEVESETYCKKEGREWE